MVLSGLVIMIVAERVRYSGAVVTFRVLKVARPVELNVAEFIYPEAVRFVVEAEVENREGNKP